VSGNVRVLIINGTDAVENIGQVFALDAYYSVQGVEQLSYTSDVLREKDLVIVNGAQDIPSGVGDDLVNFTNNGGTLLLFPGEDIHPVSSGWNNLLAALKMPQIEGVTSEGMKINKLNLQDQFFQAVFEKQPKNLSMPAISKAYRTKTNNSSLSIGLIHLQNGTPLFIRSIGSRNIFLLASSLSPNYGGFTANALFSTLLLRTGELSKRRSPLSMFIGDDARFPITDVIPKAQPLHLVSKTVDFIPTTVEKGTVTYIALHGLEVLDNLKAGTYEIVADRILGVLSLNYTRKESETACLSKNEIVASFEGQGIKNASFSEIAEGQSITKIKLEQPLEYWKHILFFAILFFMVEMAILKYWKTN
jgi:hypothetical protein